MLDKETIKQIMEQGLLSSIKRQELIEKDIDSKYIIYNEFSFQHELGIFLRQEFGKEYRVLFEKNKTKYGISKLSENNIFIKERRELQNNFGKELEEKFCKNWNVSIKLTKDGKVKYIDKSKHEMDIVLENKKVKDNSYAIELKYIPAKNKGYHASAWAILKDIQFIDELKTKGNFKDAFCIIITDIQNIYNGECGKGGDIYNNFKTGFTIENSISKKNKKKEIIDTITLQRKYKIEWFVLTWLEDMHCGIIYEDK